MKVHVAREIKLSCSWEFFWMLSDYCRPPKKYGKGLEKVLPGGRKSTAEEPKKVQLSK